MADYITKIRVKENGTTVKKQIDYNALANLPTIAQTTGDSETAIMSQKAVTDALANAGSSTGGIIDIPDEYVRITDLDTGIYKLTYASTKYIYYAGQTQTSSLSFNYINPVILYVNKRQATVDGTIYWDWHIIGQKDAANYQVAMYCGTATTAGGSWASFQPTTAIFQTNVVNNLDQSSHSSKAVLSAYQGYLLDQNKQNKTDETLETTDKTIVGAINELNGKVGSGGGGDSSVEVVQTTGDSTTAVMSQKAVTDALANAGDTPFYFVSSSSLTVSSESQVATKWYTSNVENITEPFDGMTIALRTPSMGSGFGVVLSIDNGSNYYPIVTSKNEKVYTEYQQGATIIATFNSTQTVSVVRLQAGSSTTVTGCWQINDLNSDLKVKQNYSQTNGNFPLLTKSSVGTTSQSSMTSEIQYCNDCYMNPSEGAIYATKFYEDGVSLAEKYGASAGGSTGGSQLYLHSISLTNTSNEYVNLRVASPVSTPITDSTSFFYTLQKGYWLQRLGIKGTFVVGNPVNTYTQTSSIDNVYMSYPGATYIYIEQLVVSGTNIILETSTFNFTTIEDSVKEFGSE